MKKKILVFSSIMLLVCLLVSGFNFLSTNNVAYAMDFIDDFENKIIVSGEGEVVISPDTAIISLGVESKGENLEEIQNKNSQQVENIINKLKSMGVAPGNINTENYYIYSEYDYSNNHNGRKLLGYVVSNGVSFKTKDLQNVGNLISSLVSSGANNFNGIKFTVEDTSGFYNQALGLALKNANQKAQILTGSNNIKLLSIIEDKALAGAGYYEGFTPLKANSVNNYIASGEFAIRAQVKVIYTLSNN